MELIETLLLMLLVLTSLALIGLILIQQGKGADVGAAFGSGSANTFFGSAGSASFMTRLTTWLAIAFFAITFGLAYIAKEKAVALNQIGLPSAALLEEQGAGVPVEVPDADVPASADAPPAGSSVPEVPNFDDE